MYFGILSERVKAVDGNMPETVRVYWDRGGVSVPRRRAETHKGDYGKLLIVGGSVGYTGAPNLCARSAIRSIALPMSPRLRKRRGRSSPRSGTVRTMWSS